MRWIRVDGSRIRKKNCVFTNFRIRMDGASLQEKNKHVICRLRAGSVWWNDFRLENEAVGHSFSPYGPPRRQMTYINFLVIPISPCIILSSENLSMGPSRHFLYLFSPVPEFSFLPAPNRGWTRAGEKRVQNNLHAHVQNEPIKNY